MNTHTTQDKGNDKRAAAIAPAHLNAGNDPTFRFADHRPEATVQRKLQEMANNAVSQQAPPLQRKANKTGLPDNLKSGIENLSGLSMDDVRVHRNSAKPAQLNAHAYAQGTDIHLASGQEKHLPHEAWHVVQQKQGRVKPTVQMRGKVPVNDDVGLEREADLMGKQAYSATVNKPDKGRSVRFSVSKISNAPIVQRTVSVGSDEDIITMDLEDLIDEFMKRRGDDFERSEVEKALSKADGKSWASWGDLGIWIAIGIQIIQEEEEVALDSAVEAENEDGPAVLARPSFASMAKAPASLPSPGQSPKKTMAPRKKVEKSKGDRDMDDTARADYRSIVEAMKRMNWSGSYGPSVQVDTVLKWSNKQCQALYLNLKDRFHDQPIDLGETNSKRLYYYFGSIGNRGKAGFRISGHTKQVKKIDNSETWGVLHVE